MDRILPRGPWRRYGRRVTAPASGPTVDVVVIGAGLAGLRAAGLLQDAGLDVVVVERLPEVGGRVRTDAVDGLLLDRGFQLVNPAYPEARRALDLDALDLRPFVAGLVVAHGGSRTRLGDPRRKPAWTLDALRAPFGSTADRLRFVRYAWSTDRATVEELATRPDVTTAQALHDERIGEAFVDAVVRPFLTGVFLEADLRTSRRFFDLVLRSFVRGVPAVPAKGMRAIPAQLADRLATDTLRLGVEVDAVRPGAVTTGQGVLRARAVVVAADPRAAAELLPGLAVPATASLTTWYHLAYQDPSALLDGEAVLLVDAERRGPVVNSVVMSAAAPSYASNGRVLVSSTALGVRRGGIAERDVRAHLATMYGVGTADWEHVGTYPVEHALPVMHPPLTVQHEVRLGDGIYVCGDHRDTASIQGALVSGRRAATAVIADLAS
jgi:glycine/D-amino acid oxidase-like deaminating enzyme